jgi:hypothetical protein
MEDGASAEIAVVGNEGIVGISLFMGGERTTAAPSDHSLDQQKSLRDAGLISHRRGHITVLDRAGLGRRTCECYAVVKKEYDRLLPLSTER